MFLRSDVAAIRSGCDAAGIAARQETAAYNVDQSSNFMITAGSEKPKQFRRGGFAPNRESTRILNVLPSSEQRNSRTWERSGSPSMIVGTGIDIVEVQRIAATIGRFGRRFLERVFTAGEIRYCESKANKAERYAGRFAAKEAAMKAIGTGWSRG